MTDVKIDKRASETSAAELAVMDEQIQQLADRARAEGLRLTGEGGLLGRLTKLVTEAALQGEMDDHLGYGKHDPAGRNGGNSRNGTRAKTVLTEAWEASLDARLAMNPRSPVGVLDDLLQARARKVSEASRGQVRRALHAVGR